MKAKTASESDGCSCRKISRLVWMGCCVEESIFCLREQYCPVKLIELKCSCLS
jgi:hypothetical protein